MSANSVKFYSLSSIPNTYQNGSFLNLTTGSQNNPAGLYFCFNNQWKYLVNLDNTPGVKSAAVFDNVAYFYNYTPAPSQEPGSDYMFSINLPVFDANSLSATTVTGNTTTPHTGSTNILKIDSNDKLSISDTWDCGEYNSNVYRHLKHLKSSGLVYERILKYDIPDGVSISEVNEIPRNPTSLSPVYIQTTTNHWYYKLVGEPPVASSLGYGEIAVSYSDGYERLYIKNSNDEIIEFEPANKRRNLLSNATFINGALTKDLNDNVCIWEISYSELTDAGINPVAASVFVREISTGKQLIPDVVFNDTDSVVEIYIYSTANIAASQYKAIVVGSNYNR